MHKKNQYFIALIPEADLSEEITSFKKDFELRFDSKRALRVMPHITLKVPFQLPGCNHDNLLNWFNRLDITQKPFKVELKNFGSFHNKRNRVVFINPIMNAQLSTLQKKIITSFNHFYPEHIDPHDVTFKPHMTVAYRDLKRVEFHRAWEEYKAKKYHAVFKVNNFYLLQHDKKKWNIVSVFFLQKDSTGDE